MADPSGQQVVICESFNVIMTLLMVSMEKSSNNIALISCNPIGALSRWFVLSAMMILLISFFEKSSERIALMSVILKI